MIAAAPMLSDELVADLLQRAARPDFDLLQHRLKGTGWCARPIRLRGYVCDHNGTRVWSTGSEPDGVLRKACGNRREAVCPSCAERYRQDAWHLIASGLRGGKGVPETVATHPLIFATLTAPSFGPVHSHALGPDGRPRPCRPRRDRPVCEHGHPLYCNEIHDEEDQCLGQPICPQCFDHKAAVLWNNIISKLWWRTSTYLPRKLAGLLGITQKEGHRLVRASYVKVAEYQRRGLVHFHVVIRLDRAMPKHRADEIRPPERRFTTELLADALRAAVADTAVPVDAELGGGYLRWGEQLDIRHVGLDAAIEPGRCAGYLAKYATKATEQAGGVLHPVRRDEVDQLPVSEHVREFIRAAFDLDDHAPGEHRLARNAHNLGYRGHCLTKSRRYSTTFRRLREAREDHVHAQLRGDHAAADDQRQLAELGRDRRISRFTFVGVGHLTAAEAFLAAQAAAKAREHRRLGREALADPIGIRQS
jgi:hypothetical protein